MLEGVILFIIHSFLFKNKKNKILKYFILFAVVLVVNGKAANQVRLAKKRLSPPGDPNAYMQLDHCEREIEEICKTHVMYKNKKWGEAL